MSGTQRDYREKRHEDEANVWVGWSGLVFLVLCIFQNYVLHVGYMHVCTPMIINLVDGGFGEEYDPSFFRGLVGTSYYLKP